MTDKKTFILYHADCPDGFGGAYAAWKKFGKEAEYIPVKHGHPAPGMGEGRNVYIIDFCYPQETVDELAKNSETFTILDHHKGMRSVVESVADHVYDEKRSGATIAWEYFHPNVPVPLLLRYVQTGDLYIFDMPDSRAVLSYLYIRPFHFDEWEQLRLALEDDTERRKIIEQGKLYYEYYSLMVAKIAARAEIVEFEGYETYLGNASSHFISDVGHTLSQKKGPIALVAGVAHDGIKVSIRGDGSVDVSELAKHYGGGGHPNASAFFIPWGNPLPWRSLS